MVMEQIGTSRLAAVPPAAVVRVDHILFETLRDLCFGIGLHEGDRVRCQDSTAYSMTLSDENGRTIVIDRDWARFITVTQPDPGDAHMR